MLKVIAVLNLIDDQGLLATPLAVDLAAAADDDDLAAVREALAKLQKKRVLYLRGASGGYCLWPHTSVNIDRLLAEATKAVGTVGRVAAAIAGEFDTRPVVARRHYIETGNMRHFEVRCVSPAALANAWADTAPRRRTV